MNKIDMREHVKILGYRVRDIVTGFEGVVSTVSFDLYGCVQAIVTPGLKDDKLLESCWFDVKRLKLLTKEPILPVPDFGIEAAFVPGPQEKPKQPSLPMRS